eukprot:TRINITY_DN8813_c0_g1_i2.p1 TRINITY_DN8813_c0_g1~~TRINITY_DN8813_c0_g1_i2.p1  ORF type:complete len:355 (-),score=60.52 TRINITY_DN8813_c0_g1_i2:312-1316(-)
MCIRDRNKTDIDDFMRDNVSSRKCSIKLSENNTDFLENTKDDSGRSEDNASVCNLLNSNSSICKSTFKFNTKIPQIHVKKFEANAIEEMYETLVKFEKDLKKHASDVFNSIKVFKKRLDQGPVTATEIYQYIDHLYDELKMTEDIHDIWLVRMDVDLKYLIENFIFEMIYDRIYNHDDDCRAKSHQIHEKLAVLQNMIDNDILGIPTQFRIPALMLHSQTELKKINDVKSPYNKLRVIEHVHQNLIKAIESTGKKANADDLIPMLILVVLQSNPEGLYSSLMYIQEYCSKSLLVGELGYSLMNIIAAVSFLDNLDGQSLIDGKLVTAGKCNDQQ